MKCNRCGEYKSTAGDIRQCADLKIGCQDGTAGLIAATIDGAAKIETLLAAAPGLANRFHPGEPPAQVLTQDTAAQHKAAAAAAYERGRGDGHTAGYEEGKTDGAKEERARADASAAAAYERGRGDGHTAGYEEGKTDGAKEERARADASAAADRASKNLKDQS